MFDGIKFCLCEFMLIMFDPLCHVILPHLQGVWKFHSYEGYMAMFKSAVLLGQLN